MRGRIKERPLAGIDKKDFSNENPTEKANHNANTLSARTALAATISKRPLTR
ncbi:MAG: hypothetical protein ACLUKN_00665 [Bacilli bacterium]